MLFLASGHRIPHSPVPPDRDQDTLNPSPASQQPAANPGGPTAANAALSASHAAPCLLTPAHASGSSSRHLLREAACDGRSPVFRASQASARPEAAMTRTAVPRRPVPRDFPASCAFISLPIPAVSR